MSTSVVETGIKYHAGRIRESLTDGVLSFIETGRRIIDAKVQLEHGQFLEMSLRAVASGL